MRDSLVITCPEHDMPLVPGPIDPACLYCPDITCDLIVRITPGDSATTSPLTFLEQGAHQRHEMVRAHEAAGFSRSEAMQFVLTTIVASIMKDNGSE